MGLVVLGTIPHRLRAHPPRGIAAREGHRIIRHAAGRTTESPEREAAISTSGMAGRLFRARGEQLVADVVEKSALHVEAVTPRIGLVTHRLDGEISLRPKSV